MKRMSMFLFAAVAANAILPARGGDSAPFLLDTADGTRIATEGEAIPIAYSPRWGNAASCTVDLGGSRSVATSEGTTTWTPSGTGAHTLTHTAGDLTYTAQFAVLGDDVVLHGGILAAGETWGTDKVHLVTAAVTVPSGISLTIQAGAVVKFMPGASLTVANGGSCTARGVIFTHVNDDTIGGDTLMDGDSAAPKMGDYAITGNITDDDSTEYRYMPPQTLQSSISSNTRLRGYRTYIVSNSVTVASGATLTLQPGTILKFNTGCSLTVNGTLDAQGTRAAPIVFTSLKDDAHGGDANGDGGKTYAQAGDWARIYAGGTLTMKFCQIRHCNNNSDQGAIQGTGGTVTFDNSIIESSVYECVRMNSGRFTAHNSVFRDSSMGFGYYGGSGVYLYNCVVADCTIGCRASNKHFYNTVFYRCQTFLESTSSSCDHCVFFNPSEYGAQTATQVGSNGNIWGNPLFTDPDNGDFQIAANSPCVDAGDGSVAPEVDYWGQPRMDVKAVADTGTPNGDGVCPDIGIYEVPGSAPVPLPDLAVVGGPTAVLATAGTEPGPPVQPGDTLTVAYVVTNRGGEAASGLVRDLFRFKGVDAATSGLTIDAAEVEQAYNIPAGGSATFTAAVAVPPLKEGSWKLEVASNPYRDVFEQNLADNIALSEDVVNVGIEVVDPSMPQSGVVKAGDATIVRLAFDVSHTNRMVVLTAPAGAAVSWGFGRVPMTADNTPSSGSAVLDGTNPARFIVPDDAADVYVVIKSPTTGGYSLSTETAAIVLYSVSPTAIPSSGIAT